MSPEVLASAGGGNGDGIEDYSIKLWNVTSGQIMRTLEGLSSRILWSLDLIKGDAESGDILVCGSLDQTIMLWRVSTGELIFTKNITSSMHSLVVLN